MASEDFYLKITDIEGEAESKDFEKQMQIASWSFGAHNSGSSGIGSGLGTGKVSLTDFNFMIENGKASVQLFLACCKGDHKTEAILSCRKTGGSGTPYTYYKVTFNDLVISSFSTAGSAGGGLPYENITFNFSKITHEYFQQKADGSVALSNTTTYDTKKVEGTGA